MKNRESKLYCCFSIPQKEYLKSLNIPYEIVAKNPNTDCLMWVYLKTERLNKALQNWSKANPNR